jgi:hypothetical protein
MNEEDVFNFSLIDNINGSNVSSSNSNMNLELDKLNDTIYEALSIYNKAVLHISDINVHIDKLRKKQTKILEFNEKFKDSIQELKEYVTNQFDTNENKINNVLSTIDLISDAVNNCETVITKYIDEECNKNKDSYVESKSKLNALHNIFSLVKFNKHVCPICLQNEASHFTLPCGHVYCEKCVNKIKISCFVCRQNIFKVNQLYFS